MTAYYGGRNLSHHRNIVWSNGALDPWSGQVRSPLTAPPLHHSTPPPFLHFFTLSWCRLLPAPSPLTADR